MVKKISGASPSLTKAMGIGLLLALCWTVAGAMILAKLLDAEVLPMENIGYGAMATVLTAVFFGAEAAGKRAGHMVIQAALMAGAGYFICLILVNALFFGGNYAGLGVTAVLTALATVAAILIIGRGNGKRPKRRYKIPK